MAASFEAQLKEILTRHSLKEDDLHRKCSQAIRNEIAIKVKNWQLLGHCFSIPDEKLEAIQVDHRIEEQRRVALLSTWHQREGEGATYYKLIEALYHRQRVDLVEEVSRLIKSQKAATTSSGEQQLQPEMESGWFLHSFRDYTSDCCFGV